MMQICLKLTVWLDECFPRGNSHLSGLRLGRHGDCYLFTKTSVCFFPGGKQCVTAAEPHAERFHNTPRAHQGDRDHGEVRQWALCEEITCTIPCHL